MISEGIFSSPANLQSLISKNEMAYEGLTFPFGWTLKTEYTIFQDITRAAVKGKRHKRRRDDGESMSDQRALRPGYGRPGATTRAGDNGTSSRPPKELGGALRYALAWRTAVHAEL